MYACVRLQCHTCRGPQGCLLETTYRMAGNFGGLAVLRAICQYFICQKLYSVMSSLQNHILYTRPAAKRTSLIVGMEFTIESCVQGHHFSKEFCTPKEKSSLVCQREEGDPNDVYMVAVKTDETKQSRLSVTMIW